MFRQAGMSLTKISGSRLLALPWFLKFLWAPLIDRYGSNRFGRRKSWIVPLMLMLSLTCAATAWFPPAGIVTGIFALVFFLNFLAATQDIPVDGMAVDLLNEKDLGPANVAQVVGYKFGGLVGGSVLIQLTPRFGWAGWLYSLSALLFLCTLIVIFVVREPPPEPRASTVRSSLVEVLRTMWSSLQQPGALWLVLFVATYKFGESLVDPMMKPFLIDAGYKPTQIALWVSTYGMVASLTGSALGGLLAYRLPLLTALTITATLRALSVAGEYYLTVLGKPSPLAVILITAAEHLCGGTVTTVMFAFMMSRVDKAIGATHYTLLACVEVLGKFPPALLSGFIADRVGYQRLFLVGAVLSFGFLLLIPPLQRSQARTAQPA